MLGLPHNLSSEHHREYNVGANGEWYGKETKQQRVQHGQAHQQVAGFVVG